MRAASFTAGPIMVKSSRSGVPTLPYSTSPLCKAMPRSRLVAVNPPSPLASAVTSRTDRTAARSACSHTLASGWAKVARMPSPMNFRISPPSAVIAAPTESK